MTGTWSSRNWFALAARAGWTTAAMSALALASAQPASAHTDFDFSVPADGDVVEQPVSEITVAFTNPATPAGEGFEVLDAAGTFLTPVSIDESDGTAFVLSFDPPLADGRFGVRWEVQAGDAHPISGTFSFTVSPGAATTTTKPTTTTMAVAPTIDPGVTAPSATTAVTDTARAVGSSSTTSPEPTESDKPATTLEEFLAADGSDGGADLTGWVGRFLSTTGLVVALGAVIALVWVVEGRRDEIRDVLAWARLAGLVVATGGLVEFAALQAVQQGDLADLAGSRAGVAALLKVVGGLFVFFGTGAATGRITAPARSLSAAGAITQVERDGAPESMPTGRWRPTASALGLGVGLAAALVSFWFDGHTVTTGPWVVHSLANLVHLVAASAWAGGVMVLAVLLWQRRRDGVQSGAATMIVRFSSVASIALVAVAAAGALMAFFVLDSPGGLTSSDWGRALLVKTAAVAIAAALGAYNHFRLKPALESRPQSTRLSSEFRRTLYVEGVVFVVVLAASAWLVAAAT